MPSVTRLSSTKRGLQTGKNGSFSVSAVGKFDSAATENGQEQNAVHATLRSSLSQSGFSV